MKESWAIQQCFLLAPVVVAVLANVPYRINAPLGILGTLSLSIGYQDVDGLHRKWLGCKIPHIKELIIHDIRIISETWSCSHSKDIENYSYFQIEPQKSKQTKSGRSSGGIIVYYKSYLESYIDIIKRDNQYNWLKISKSLFNNLNNDI